MPSPKNGPEAVARAPQRRRGHDRVASLLDAAAAIFTRDGYDAATMTEVAARAGASIGSLYQFFPTKPLLAEALYLRELDALTAVLDRAGEEVLAVPCRLDRLGDRLFGELVAFTASHPALPILADRRDANLARNAEPRRDLRTQFAELMARAEPTPSPGQARHAAALLHLMMKAAVAVQISGDTETETLIEDIRVMLCGHLANWNGGQAA